MSGDDFAVLKARWLHPGKARESESDRGGQMCSMGEMVEKERKKKRGNLCE